MLSNISLPNNYTQGTNDKLSMQPKEKKFLFYFSD